MTDQRSAVRMKVRINDTSWTLWCHTHARVMKELVKAVLAIVLLSSQLLLYIGVTWRVIGGQNFDRHKEWAGLVDLINVTAHTGHPIQLGLIVAVPLVYVSLGVSLVYSLLCWLTRVYNWLLGCYVQRSLAAHRKID
jgi:hypothetical protein